MLTNGIIFLEWMDEAKTQPYKLWNADLAKCEVCEAEVVFRFAGNPFAQHFEEDFATSLEEARNGDRILVEAY